MKQQRRSREGTEKKIDNYRGVTTKEEEVARKNAPEEKMRDKILNNFEQCENQQILVTNLFYVS